MEDKLAALVARLENVAMRLERTGGASSGSAAAEDSEVFPQWVADFEEFITSNVAAFVQLCGKIGGDVAEASGLVQKAFEEQLAFLRMASKSKKPSVAELQNLMKGIVGAVSALSEMRSKRRSTQDKHLQALCEGMSALGWVSVEKTPSPFVREMLAASEFYLNRILMEFKGKDENHVEFCKSFKKLLSDLADYVKANHTTGVSWNPNGKDASQVAVAAPAAKAAAPAPAAAAPAPAAAASNSGAAAPARPSLNAMFAEISKGEGVTSGLKHVTKDMKTKNMADRAPAVVPATAPAAAPTPKAAGGKKPRGPARFECEDDKKWIVENQEGNQEIVINETNLRQAVYVRGCHNSVVQINGKVNSVFLDDCTRTGVVFENAVASCEIVNCTSVQVQIKGYVPSIAVDKTSGIQLFLSEEGLKSEIVTSKSSEMNVLIPDGDDMTEVPLPEQYVTKWDAAKKKFVTGPSSHV